MDQLFLYLSALICLSSAKTLVDGDPAKSYFVLDECNSSNTFEKHYMYDSASDGWLKFHRAPSTWHSARQICDLEGARLASPLNDNLYDVMKLIQQSTQGQTIYTGVFTMATGNDYFSEEGVALSDMRVPWAENEPNNLNNEERCIAMTSGGALADVKCDSAHGFICYKPFTTDKCKESDYIKDDRIASCYKFHLTAVTWDQAHTTCSAEGGHLVIINSNLEAQILSELPNINGNTAHIGLYNWSRYNKGYSRWSTLDGKKLEDSAFSRWGDGQPDNDTETCGAALIEGNRTVLHDYTCSSQLPFICEIETGEYVHTIHER